MINENLIDLMIRPTIDGQMAELKWRPQVPGYKVINEVKTSATDNALSIQITSDKEGRSIRVQGSIPVKEKEVVRNFPIKDPVHFARAALNQALNHQGISVDIVTDNATPTPCFVYLFGLAAHSTFDISSSFRIC